jgi:phosphoserine phosphatase RsbU/P
VGHNVMPLLLLGHVENTGFDWVASLLKAGWAVQQKALADFQVADCARFKAIIFFPATFLPYFSLASAEEIVRLIRMGVTDVLLEPVTERELLAAVSRVDRHQQLYSNNLKYSRKLEKANKELSESLNILKMDQIAGRQVQKSLLPQEPISHQGYFVTHTIIPSLYLSGDFVAYNLTFDRYILFFLADVSGHGASSAFVTILLRFILKRIIRKHVYNNDVKALLRAPEGFIEHVNRQLLATGLEKQVTMFAGAINTETNILRYGVAAQMPMPVFIAGNDARYLPGRGKIIGLFDDVSWEIEEIALPEKFRLVMVSDGLLETLPGKGLAEQEASLLQILANSPPDHQGVCRALGVDKITEVADDVSILTISRGVGR